MNFLRNLSTSVGMNANFKHSVKRRAICEEVFAFHMMNNMTQKRKQVTENAYFLAKFVSPLSAKMPKENKSRTERQKGPLHKGTKISDILPAELRAKPQYLDFSPNSFHFSPIRNLVGR